MRSPASPLAGPAAILLLVLTACGTATGTDSATDSTTAGSEVVERGPARDLDFASQTVAGESFDGTTLAGKPAVLWFWAPWCPTCRAQIEGVGTLAERHEGEVNVVGVGALDDPEAIAGFADEVAEEVTVLTDQKGAVWRHFGVTAQSTYLVLDEDGAEVASGFLDDARLAELVDGLVG
ncbi:TlpA family protein disulfide reductase [Nocardioides donggukensis]|uniref:Redoxin family protein n=1 Tax=Nocardioides donggukensis TaxID=2774019 RepID=A0A927Q3A8_9ACTN|nr:redoxin family protein [Nocardioides donggukensis]MBD8870421.1 redoxin family protein [Nocardioides donggukensis]